MDTATVIDPSKGRDMLRQATRLNATIMGIVLGLTSGLAIFVFTHVSMAVTGEESGLYLNLLSVFLPGFSASGAGAWFGLLWGFVIGGACGSVLYTIYVRSAGRHIADLIASGSKTRQIVKMPTLRVSGHAIGVALGAIAGVQLLIATSWLVIRGTAEQSAHAALLTHYLPGYSVSLTGAVIGALDLFVITYVFSLIFSYVYNCVASARQKSGDAK